MVVDGQLRLSLERSIGKGELAVALQNLQLLLQVFDVAEEVPERERESDCCINLLILKPVIVIVGP